MYERAERELRFAVRAAFSWSMADCVDQLNAVAALGEQKAKVEKYGELLSAALARADVPFCKAFVEHSASTLRSDRILRALTARAAVLSDRNPLVISRQLLTSFAQGVARLPADLHKEVAAFALDKIQPRAVSFEEQERAQRHSVRVRTQTRVDTFARSPSLRCPPSASPQHPSTSPKSSGALRLRCWRASSWTAGSECSTQRTSFIRASR